MSSAAEALVEALEDNISILCRSSEANWAAALEALLVQAKVDASSAAPQIMRIFGGMGSFNDVVLVEDGEVLVEANNRLNEARERLHRACLEARRTE